MTLFGFPAFAIVSIVTAGDLEPGNAAVAGLRVPSAASEKLIMPAAGGFLVGLYDNWASQLATASQRHIRVTKILSRTDVARSGASGTEEAGYAWMAFNYSGVGEESRDSLPASSSKCMGEGSYELRSHWGSGGVDMPHISVIHSRRRLAHSARG